MSTSSTKASTSKQQTSFITICDVNMLFFFPSFHQNYLSSRGKTWRDLLQESLQALQQGNYHLSGELSDQNQVTFITELWTLQSTLSYKKKKSGYILSFIALSDCRISSNVILCFCCGLRAFKELAYKYRQNIPPPELPGQTGYNISYTDIFNPISAFQTTQMFVMFMSYPCNNFIFMSLPSAAVTSRPDCYWGRNCRTQVKAHHAM